MKVKKLKDRNGVVFTPLTSADSVYLRSSSKDLTTKLSELDSVDETINSKIPSVASSSNQLADKAFVNSTIQTTTANYRGTFSEWSDVPTDPTQYVPDYDGGTTPTQNDYMYVRDASSYPVGTGEDPLEGVWKFKFIGDWSTVGKSGWNPEFQVNDTVFTQAQSDALNSGITSTLVSDYSGHVSDTDIHVTTSDKSSWNAKQSAITGAATSITDSDLTASRALTSNSSGKVAVSSVTSTELERLSGVTSSVQTQLDSKQGTITGAATSIVSSDLTASKVLTSNSNGKVAASSISDTELGYLSGVTSNIQSQIDSAKSTFVFTQALASSTWDIVHNLDKYPNITTVDNNGNVMRGDITYISSNEIEVLFSVEVTGKAFIN